VHRVKTGDPLHWNGQPEGLDALRGRLAFVRMVNAAQAQPLIDRLHRLCTEMVSFGGNPDSAQILPGVQS
jgi:hypothetical protein